MEVQEALLNLSSGKMDTLYESLESTIMACAHTHAELWKQLFKLILSALQSKIVITMEFGVYWRSYLQSWPRWHTRAHSVQQQREPVRPHVRHSKMSWLMCSVPVQVNEHVSLQHSTWRGEASGWLSDGHTMDITTFLSICPLGLVARHWAVVKRVRAAWYARPRTAAMNGVQPSVSLTREKCQ